MSQRSELALLYKLLRRRMDQERRAFNKALLRAARGVVDADEPMSAYVLLRMQNARQPVLDEWYGRFPGDEGGRFTQLIIQQGALAHRMAAARERAQVEHELRDHPELLRRLREPAG